VKASSSFDVLHKQNTDILPACPKFSGREQVRRFRSQIAQSLHYFARPHEGVRRTAIASKAAWRGTDFEDASAYREMLTKRETDEIESAVQHARSTGRPLGALQKSDFPLPTLEPKLRRWRDALRDGRGFQIIGGVPVEALGTEGAEIFFWCFGLHFGIPGAQNPQGDLLGHVRDTGAPADGSVRQYRTNEDIDFHCDLADVVGLLCLRGAKEGGRSRIVSSVTAYNELLTRRPDLASRLYEPVLMDTKGEGGVPYLPIVPCAHAAGELRTFWHIGYFRSVSRYQSAPPMDERTREALDLYDEIMNEDGVALEMDFLPGDIQLLSNHTIAHGRTGFVDHDTAEDKRHLLRLWLSLDGRLPLRLRLMRERSRASVLARLAWARVAYRR